MTGLAHEGVDQCVIMPNGGALADRVGRHARTITVTSMPWWIKEFRSNATFPKRVYRFLSSVQEIRSVIKRERPDLVVSNTLVIPTGAISAKLEAVPHVWYAHEFVEDDHGLSFEFGRNLSLRAVDFLSDVIILNSQTVSTRLKNELVTAKKIHIYCAVQVGETFHEVKKDPGKLHLALIGRKVPGKGQADAIRAVSELKKNGIDPHLWLVGSSDKSYETELLELSQSLGISSNVEFISHTPDPHSYMKAADIVLVCSRMEAFGRVTVEAMKLGKAVIGSDSGANPELIRHMHTGLLYESGSPLALANQISVLFHDRSLLGRLGENARTWSTENFNLKAYSSDLLTAFDLALKA